MKKIVCFAFLIAALGIAFQTAAVPQHEAKGVVASVQTDDRVLDFRTGMMVAANVSPREAAQTLPYCGNYDGNTCSTVGASFRCQWQPGEPGRCFCNDSKVWTCG
jgi:hypothetical protein